MSFMKDLLLGQEGTPGRIEDLRTNNEMGLNTDTTNVLRDLIQGHFTPRLQGPTAAGMTGGEQQTLTQLNNLVSGGLQTGDVGRQALTGILGGGGGTGNTMLNLAGQIQDSGAFRSLTDLQGPGSMNPILQAFGQNPDQSQAAMTAVQDILTGRTQDANNPIVQNAIDAATRPIRQQFEDQLAMQRSQFNQAGQQVQGQGSSPFQMAQSRLNVGLANALGDVGSNIAFQNLSQERGRQMGLIDTLTGAFESGQNRRAGAAGQQLNTASNAFGVLNDAFGDDADRTLTGALNAPSFDSNMVQTLSQALDAQALPRLIEQFGLDAGREQFNTQQQQLLQVLQLGLQGGRPQNVTLPGTEATPGLLQTVAGGLATGAGGPLGTAIGSALF